MTTVHQLGPASLSCHAWSGDSTSLAVSHKNKEVVIYNNNNNRWEKQCVLDQHDRRVTGIDWAPNTNRIVTCSEDKNAYVWNKTGDGKWKQTLVLLRINRAATCVRWSPEENKFAVGSGARLISICYFEEENNWWVAKHIKKPLHSTVTSLDWHPSNILLAVGTMDFKVRVFSGYVREIEAKPAPTEWGAKMPIGNMMAEFSNSKSGGGWVHSVAFSGDGTKLAWVAHDSSISVADAAAGNTVMKLKTSLLPMLSVLWVSPTSLVAAGHDFVPVMFSVSEGGLVEGGRLEDNKKVDKGPTSAMKMFQNKVNRGEGAAMDTAINTTHQNQVNEMRLHSGEKGAVRSISSCGGDGKLVIWDLKSLSTKMGSLKI